MGAANVASAAGGKKAKKLMAAFGAKLNGRSSEATTGASSTSSSSSGASVASFRTLALDAECPSLVMLINRDVAATDGTVLKLNGNLAADWPSVGRELSRVAGHRGPVVVEGDIALAAGFAAAVLLVQRVVSTSAHALDRVRAILSDEEAAKAHPPPRALDLLSTLERPWALALLPVVGVPRLVAAWQAEGAEAGVDPTLDFSLVDSFREAAAVNRKKRKQAEDELRKAKKTCSALIASAEDMKTAMEAEIANLRAEVESYQEKLREARDEHTGSLTTMMQGYEAIEGRQDQLEEENTRLRRKLEEAGLTV
jgi:hypothetical protein